GRPNSAGGQRSEGALCDAGRRNGTPRRKDRLKALLRALDLPHAPPLRIVRVFPLGLSHRPNQPLLETSFLLPPANRRAGREAPGRPSALWSVNLPESLLHTLEALP